VNEPAPEYWFPARRYGWGWGPPISWQGWAFFILWLLVFFGGVGYFRARRSLMPVAFVAAMLMVLLAVCYWKGKPPRWRWGK
jgi:hypothetical protein